MYIHSYQQNGRIKFKKNWGASLAGEVNLISFARTLYYLRVLGCRSNGCIAKTLF